MKKINKTPGYMYLLVVGALAIATFAVAVALKYIQLGEIGLKFNF